MNYYYMIPQYSNGYDDKNVCNPCDSFYDKNKWDFFKRKYLIDNPDYLSFDCEKSFTWKASSGYETDCEKITFELNQNFFTKFPEPNINCCLNLKCSLGQAKACFSTYFWSTQEPGYSGAYTPLTDWTSQLLVLYVDQVYTLSASDLVKFQKYSQFNLISPGASMYLLNDKDDKTISVSGNNILISFGSIRSKTAYYIMLYTNRGRAYSNQFSLKVIECSPSITVKSSYIQTVTSITVQYSVFTAASSDDQSSYCSRKQFKLYDSSGSNDVSSTTKPYSFNTATGEFKITKFTGYFSQNFYVKVVNQFNNAPEFTASQKSDKINVQYSIDCTPKIKEIGNFINQVSSFATPYTLFTASKYFSAPNPCALSYKIFSYPSEKDITNIKSPFQFYQASGLFQITDKTTNQIIEYKIKIEVTASYQSISASSNSSEILIRQVICKPKLKELSSLLSYSINTLQFPFIVFKASTYASTSNPDYCSLSYNVFNQDGSAITPYQFIEFNQTTGSLQITRYQYNDILQFEQNIILQLTSKYNQFSTISESISKQMSIKIYTCFPQIQNQQIKDSYNITVGQDTSINNPLLATIFDAFNITSTASLNKLCQLTYQTYYQNGTQATIENSNFYNVQSAMTLQITTNINSTQNYYFKATSTSESPSYSNSLNSKLFTINIIAYKSDKKIQSSDQTNCKNDKVQLVKTLPQQNEPYFNKYKLIDENPVLFLNLSQKESINVDIKSRFKNSFPKSCPLIYKISEINFNGSTVNRTITDTFISLVNNGILNVKQQNKYAFNNYQIFIIAQNKAKINSSLNGYLIDLSVYQQQSQNEIQSSSIKTKLSKAQACSGFIGNLNQQGVVKIIFNDLMNTNINISLINETNTLLYIKPGGGRQDYEDYDPSTLRFTWTVISFAQKTMLIKINFDQPLAISPLIQQDKLFINFKESRDFLFCNDKKRILDQDYSIFQHSIPQQETLDQSSFLAGLGTSGEIFSNGPLWLLISGGAIALLGYGNMEYYIIYVRSLQFVLLIPGIPIVLPANVVKYFSMIKSVADYDILSYVDVWNLPGLNKIVVDQNAPIKINDQMQNIGYQNRNALYGLGTFAFIIYLYFIRLGLVMLIKLYQKISKNKKRKNKLFYQLENGLFYNNLYSLAIEGMIELLINGYLNLMTAQITTNGEIMGVLLSAFSTFFSSTVLPLTIMWMICFKNRAQLQSNEFQEKFGVLFEGVNLKLTSSRFYFFVFWARRMIQICLILFIDSQKGYLILLIILFLNILFTKYVGSHKRLKNRKLNFIEWFNEMMISGCYYMMIILTDMVPSQANKFFHGFVLTLLVIFYSFANVLLILYVNFKSIMVISVKYLNLFNHYFKQKPQSNLQKEEKLKESVQEKLEIDIQDQQVIPNILVHDNKMKINIQNQAREDILKNEDKKINRIFDNIILKLKNEKQKMKQLNINQKKENQQKTLKSLIENPKKFIKPKLEKIIEEDEFTVNPQIQNKPLNKQILIPKQQIQISKKQELNKKESEIHSQDPRTNEKMNADEFMKKHQGLQKIDQDGTLKNYIQNIFKIINSPNNDDFINGRRNNELTKIKDLLKIDLILLKTSQSYKDYKFWEEKIDLFEKDSNQLFNGQI